MAKDVKKIKWTGEGTVKSSLSVPNRKVTIDPDQYVWFTVGEWDEGLAETDKRKSLTWMLQDKKAKTIIKQKALPAGNKYGLKLSKNLCGSFEYYIEASLSGNRDLKRETGLIVSGFCEPKITTSKWCTTNDGDDVRKSHVFSYGEAIYLNIETEGLNGSKNLIVDVFRHENLKTDPLIFTYTSVDVIDGEINLAMLNTFSWYGKIKGIKEDEEFYVKIKDASTGKYIVDSHHDIIHARFLKIKKKIVSREVKPPTNLTPLKVGKPDEKAERYEPCKFDTIAIDKTIVFDKGKSKKGAINPKGSVTKTIFFDFDVSTINSEGNAKLNKTLQFLLENQSYSITVAGYACVIGKENYNQGLSQKRSDAVKKMFIDGGLDPKRIISKGFGEIQIQTGDKNYTIKSDDDKKGKDNVKFKDEKAYIEARRVDVSFDYTGHALTIYYETIAPSHDKNVTIDITDFQNKACFREKNKHEKKIRVTSPEYAKKNEMEKSGDTIDFPIHSSLETWNVAPMQYIWPKYNLLDGATGKGLDSANVYKVYAHSCRYFSEEKYTTVLVKAYPDIKWDFHFFLNLSNKLSVKWQHLPPGKDKEMKSKAGKIGAEKRWKQTEVDFGVILEANWDKIDAEKYKGHYDGTLKYEAKIKQFYSVFASLKEFSKGVTEETKGTVSKSRLGKKLGESFSVEMNPPNFCLGAVWQLARGEKNGKKTTEIGTEVKFYFKAEPLIALALNIDLLAGLVQALAAGTTAGAGNLAAKKIFYEVREWLSDDGHSIKLKMYIDLEITGTINGSSNFTINTSSDKNIGDGQLETVLKAELKAGVEIKGVFVTLIAEAYVEAEASVIGSVSATFGHGIFFENNTKESKVYYQPTLKFNGLKVTGTIKAKVGLSIKKGLLEGKDYKKELVDYNFEKDVFPPFDIIEKFEKVTGLSSKIQLT
jgi:outer membrane protein OmpA-like peptidoglycan-associated protein